MCFLHITLYLYYVICILYVYLWWTIPWAIRGGVWCSVLCLFPQPQMASLVQADPHLGKLPDQNQFWTFFHRFQQRHFMTLKNVCRFAFCTSAFCSGSVQPQMASWSEVNSLVQADLYLGKLPDQNQFWIFGQFSSMWSMFPKIIPPTEWVWHMSAI